LSTIQFTPEYLAARAAALANLPGPVGMDDLDPTGPSGHAYGIGVSSRLTSTYRRQKGIAMDVTPEQVIECMNDAKIKNWVLMGLHGYVGYMPMPRATQDVDVMVPYSGRAAAEKAIAARWPELIKSSLPQVTRFMDGNDLDSNGRPKPVVDLMLPWAPFQVSILRKHFRLDPKTNSRFPTIEAAIVSKYAPLVSPHRSWERKQQDGVDLRNLIRNNIKDIDRTIIRDLANQVWEGGGAELLEFVELALQEKPFPV